MVKAKAAVVKFKKVTVVIRFVGEGCQVKEFKKKKPSAAWKKLIRVHKRASGVRKYR